MPVKKFPANANAPMLKLVSGSCIFSVNASPNAASSIYSNEDGRFIS